MSAFRLAFFRRHHSRPYRAIIREKVQMKPLISALRVVSVIAFGGLSACSQERPAVTEKAPLAHDLQAATWQPSPGHTQVPIWPGAVPDAQPAPGPEHISAKDDHVIAGKHWLEVDNVSQPTMTVYAPKRNNTGVAVVVFPGGGYQILAIDLEGTEICDWLTSRGITAVLLKYRVPTKRVGPYWESPQALQDAQRTLGLVRFHAAEWHIDPHKIGVIGFSAGGHMVAATSTHDDQRSYPPIDAADQASCRPDFAIALYPGHLWVEDPEDDKDDVRLNPNVPVNSNTPPTFILQATDDPVDSINNSLVYYLALKKAKVPVEMHLYAQGGHGFGLRRNNLPITEWPALAEKWLATIGMISK
jgi:acetyl esterase/lipase